MVLKDIQRKLADLHNQLEPIRKLSDHTHGVSGRAFGLHDHITRGPASADRETVAQHVGDAFGMAADTVRATLEAGRFGWGLLTHRRSGSAEGAEQPAEPQQPAALPAPTPPTQ